MRGETGEKREKNSAAARHARENAAKAEGAMPRVAPESNEEETRRSKRHVQARARYHALPATERVKRSRLNELLRLSRRLLLTPEQDAARKKKNAERRKAQRARAKERAPDDPDNRIRTLLTQQLGVPAEVPRGGQYGPIVKEFVPARKPPRASEWENRAGQLARVTRGISVQGNWYTWILGVIQAAPENNIICRYDPNSPHHDCERLRASRAAGEVSGAMRAMAQPFVRGARLLSVPRVFLWYKHHGSPSPLNGAEDWEEWEHDRANQLVKVVFIIGGGAERSRIDIEVWKGSRPIALRMEEGDALVLDRGAKYRVRFSPNASDTAPVTSYMVVAIFGSHRAK